MTHPGAGTFPGPATYPGDESPPPDLPLVSPALWAVIL